DYEPAAGTLTFAAGVTFQTFSVHVHDAGTIVPDATVGLVLSSPGGGGMLGSPAASVLTILSSSPVLQFSAASYVVSEAAAAAIVRVKRSGSMTGPVSVDYATSDGSALEGVDYKPARGTLVFSQGVAGKAFAVPLLTDAVHEPGETVLLSLSHASPGALVGPRGAAVLSIGDNDAAGTVSFTAARFTVGETAGTATITV